MELNLKKPIVFFDLETTGLNIATDRIVEISILKINPNKKKENKTWLVNPTITIPAEVSKIHGITDEKVKHQPTFKEIGKEIKTMIKGCDLGGYNSNRFDIPLLAEEFLRSDIDLDLKKHRAIDIQNIFHKMEQRTLSAAYKFYCQKELLNAHSAEADTLATYEILLAQLSKYDNLENDINFLADFSIKGQRTADLAGFVIYNENDEECFSFGKYKGEKVSVVFKNNPGYFSWIQQAQFPIYTKKILTQIKLRESK